MLLLIILFYQLNRVIFTDYVIPDADGGAFVIAITIELVTEVVSIGLYFGMKEENND